MFKTIVPPRRHHATFLAEIAAFVRAQAAMLSSTDRARWPLDFVAPLMREYLGTVYLRVDRHAEWHSNLAGGYVARPGEAISAIVTKKTAKQDADFGGEGVFRCFSRRPSFLVGRF